MDQCIPCVLRGSANLPAPVLSQLRFITTLLRHYRFCLHCVPLRSGSLGAFSHSQGWGGKTNTICTALSRIIVGIRWRRTTPVKAATPRAATTITLRDARDISFKLPFVSDPEYIWYLCWSNTYTQSLVPYLTRILFYFYMYLNIKLPE